MGRMSIEKNSSASDVESNPTALMKQSSIANCIPVSCNADGEIPAAAARAHVEEKRPSAHSCRSRRTKDGGQKVEIDTALILMQCSRIECPCSAVMAIIR